MRHTRIIVTHYGGPDALRVVEEECPEPKDGEVRVRVLAAGVSLPDIMAREGVHPETPRLPFTPGWDLVGVVDRLGAGVSGIEPGQIVAALPISGAYAEFICLPHRELVPVPSGLDAAEAVSLVLNYVTAYQMLHRSAQSVFENSSCKPMPAGCPPIPPCYGLTFSLLCDRSGAHTPQCVPETPNSYLSEKTTPMPCSPVYAGSLYPCDLTDAEWAQLAPLLPAPARRGRPRAWPLRLLVNALFYVLRTGCAWRYLPREYPPWQTTYTTFRQWRLHGVWQRLHEALRRTVRLRAGRHADPSAAIMDSQSVKTTEESGGIKGYDGGKQVKGRKRHILVDTLGLLLSVEVTPANTSDQAGARRLLIGLKPLQPRLELIWADGSYSGEPLATWCAAEGAWRVEIIKPTSHGQGFVVRPWCWIVERTLGWLGRQRRLSKDYERKLQTSETLLKLAMIRLMLRRLARSPA